MIRNYKKEDRFCTINEISQKYNVSWHVVFNIVRKHRIKYEKTKNIYVIKECSRLETYLKKVKNQKLDR